MIGSYFASRRPAPSEAAGENVELDVTPVMNMFVILIPFLVSMAVFTHLSIIEFSVPPNVGVGLAAAENEKPRLKLTVVAAETFCSLTLGDSLLDSLPRTAADYPIEELRIRLVARRAVLAVQDEVVVATRDKVQFKDLVALMDVCRESGFEKIGLSAAPSQPLAKVHP
jgi:biopolymer transport protein ExbD